MKKLLTASFLALIIPLTSHAAVNPGVEFLTPLVQTIIGLLQDRISDLVGENTALRAQVASCQTLGSQAQPPIGPTQEPSQPTTPAAPIVATPTPAPPQTVSVSYVYRTDAPYVAQGNTQDRCPTFTFASDKQIFVEKLVFYTPSKIEVVGSDVVSVSGGKIKTYRKCFGDIYSPTILNVSLSSESLIYGADGVRIPIQDVGFSY